MLLNCHSHFSLRYGTISEDELLKHAAEAGFRYLALTDINNTSGCLTFLRLAPDLGISPAVGVDFRNGIDQQFVALALNNQGFLEINRYLSHTRLAKENFEPQAPHFNNAAVVYPFAKVVGLGKLRFAPNEYIGVALKDLRKIPFSPVAKLKDRFVLLHPWSFRNRRDFNIHRLLRAIDGNTLLGKLTPHHVADEEETLLTAQQLRDRLKDFPELVRNTEKLLERCDVRFTFGANRQNHNLKVFSQSEKQDYQLILSLCEKGLTERYGPQPHEKIRKRLESELDLIAKKNFIPFFLVSWHIVNYARTKGYYYVGRGSGANSIVAYLLRITNVDPIELDLYFERFLNLHRETPPDFDIDFSWRDREDVTRFIFDEFGKSGRVALLATYNTFQHRGAVRELGKVFGLPAGEIDALSERKFDPKHLDDITKLVVKYAGFLKEIPNHLSVHAGGILISQEPMHYFTATDVPPKGFPTTQFDMHVAEDVGLNKYDILGQRGLAKIKEALAIVAYNRPDAPIEDIDNVEVFKNDPKVNALIQHAECIGCFYVESPAMRVLLKKLEVDNYLDLVAASSIIRPGVAQSGMMREFILRHKKSPKAGTAHPQLLDLMPDTYGVMVYQEDVIKVAHYFAGLTLAEADVLRRGMSGKFRGREEFQRAKEKFFENCMALGHADAMAKEVWLQIESFAGYAFAKGHSASYAVESYQALYLKAYFPLEFIVAVLNNGGGFYSPEFYVHEARREGGIIQLPCINRSECDTVIYGDNIFLGFHLMSGLEDSTIKNILKARASQGEFSSLNDFIDRVPVSVEQITLLIRIGAFRSTRTDKKTLLWKALFRLNSSRNQVVQKPLFTSPVRDFDLPEFSNSGLEDAHDELDILGFTLSDPFEMLAEKVPLGTLVNDFPQNIGDEVLVFGYLVTVKKSTTKTGEGMFFGTFLDQQGNYIDSVHFPPVARAFPFTGKGVYKIMGKITDDLGALTLEVSRLKRLPFLPSPGYVKAY